MKYSINFLLLAIATNAQAKEEIVFDPKHLHFGNNKYMKEVRNLLAKEKNAQLKAAELATKIELDAQTSSSNVPPQSSELNAAPESNAAFLGELDAATKIANSAPAIVEKAERRLRGTESSHGLFSSMTASMDSFWEGIVESIDTAWQETIQIFEGPPQVNVSDVVPNITLTPTFEPTVASTNTPTLAPVAPVKKPAKKPANKPAQKVQKRAEVYIESENWLGDKECRVKSHTYFHSSTVGVEACFLSSLATEEQPIYTLINYLNVKDLMDAEEALSTSFVVRLFYDSSCSEELKMKGYYPLSAMMPNECTVTPDSNPVESSKFRVWKLSHAPHRETAPHQMSISLFSRGRDCIKGQEGGTLQERKTVSYGSRNCLETDEGYGYHMKCLEGGDVSIHFFKNPQCEGEASSTHVISREEMCKSEWSGDFTTGVPVVQCGVGENWEHESQQPGLELAK